MLLIISLFLTKFRTRRWAVLGVTLLVAVPGFFYLQSLQSCPEIRAGRFGLPVCDFEADRLEVASLIVEMSPEWPRRLASLCAQSCAACTKAVSAGVRVTLSRENECVDFESLEHLRSELELIFDAANCRNDLFLFYMDRLHLILWLPFADVEEPHVQVPLYQILIKELRGRRDADWSGIAPSHASECRSPSPFVLTEAGHRTSYFDARRCYNPVGDLVLDCADLLTDEQRDHGDRLGYRTCVLDSYYVKRALDWNPIW